MTSKYNQIINWCISNPYNHLSKIEANIIEKSWGNEMINAVGNGQWTTKLGEYIVAECIKEKGNRVIKPKTINHFRPDLETNNYIYEIKTRNYSTSGTAGEKVLGCPYKYSDIPRLYNKPLRIVCVAYQEYELTNGNYNVFGDNISEEKKEMLKYWKERQIEFIKFSDIIENKLIDY